MLLLNVTKLSFCAQCRVHLHVRQKQLNLDKILNLQERNSWQWLMVYLHVRFVARFCTMLVHFREYKFIVRFLNLLVNEKSVVRVNEPKVAEHQSERERT